MQCTRFALLVALAAAVSWCRQATAQNLLTDPGFENPALFTSDGAPFVGSWEAFNGGAGTSAQNDTVAPRTGARDAHFNITATNNSFAGIFQDVPVVAGVPYTYSGFHQSSDPNPSGYVSEARIEWRSTVPDTEISRNNTTPVAGAAYTSFSSTFTAPPGADIARIVYAIQTFTDAGTTNTGNVFLDDLSVTVAPEPSTIALAALGCLALPRPRRRA